jgi:hypothetical protein
VTLEITINLLGATVPILNQRDRDRDRERDCDRDRDSDLDCDEHDLLSFDYVGGFF